MNDIKLVEFIRKHALMYDLTKLSIVAGVEIDRLEHVIRDNDLYNCVITKFDRVIHDLTTHEPKTYTIAELAEKHDINYFTFWRYIRDIGFGHLFVRPKRRSANHTVILLKLLESYPVVRVANIAKEQGLIPASRQGIYDLCLECGVTPLKMADVK